MAEGPRVAKTCESEGPKDEQSQVPVSALASATICFSRTKIAIFMASFRYLNGGQNP